MPKVAALQPSRTPSLVVCSPPVSAPPGIWVRPNPSAAPVLTLCGSTNLNSRSANLDAELSFVLATTSPELQKALADEVDGLHAHAHQWRGEERKVRVGTRVLTGLVGGML